MNLTILVLGSDEDQGVIETLADIATHDLLKPFVVLHTDQRCEYIDGGQRDERDLWKLLAECKLDLVTLIRVACDGRSMVSSEVAQIDSLRRRLIASGIQVVIGSIVAPLSNAQVSPGAFQPFWDINIIVQPLDSAGEAGFFPIDVDDRDRQIALTAAAIAVIGGLWSWLDEGPLQGVTARAQGNEQRVRIARVISRLVDAGDLTARAVAWALTPGAQLPPPPGCVRHGATEQAVAGLLDAFAPESGQSPLGFSYVPLPEAQAPQRQRLGIMATIRLFAHEVVAEIRKMPGEALERGVQRVIVRLEDAVTRKTFGSDSEIIVTLREPQTLDLAMSSQERVAQVRNLANMGPLAATPSAQTWGQLVRGILAAADGDDMPESLRSAQPTWSSDRAVVGEFGALAPQQLADPIDPSFRLSQGDLQMLSWNDSEEILLRPTDVIAINAARSRLGAKAAPKLPPPAPPSNPEPVSAPLSMNRLPSSLPLPAASWTDPANTSPRRPLEPPKAATAVPAPETGDSREALSKRLNTWSRPYESSLVYRLAERIVAHQQRALTAVGALEGQLNSLLEELTKAANDVSSRRKKFVRRVLMTLLILLILLAISVVGFVLVSVVVGIVLAVVFVVSMIGGLLSIYSRGAKRVREGHRLDDLADRPAQLMAQRQHAAEEYARLNDLYEVYHDWARITASALHRPWGTVDSEAISPWVKSTGTLSFISGEPVISQDQMTRTSLGLAQAVAKRGWLSSAYRDRRENLVQSYRQITAGLAGTEKDPELDYTGDDVLTALDGSADIGPVKIYAPRTHFRMAYVAGDFADEYRTSQIDHLRSTVEKNDPSSMIKEVRCDVRGLTGRTPEAFLRPIVESSIAPDYTGVITPWAQSKVKTESWCGISPSIVNSEIPAERHVVSFSDLNGRFALASFRLDVTEPLAVSDLLIVGPAIEGPEEQLGPEPDDEHKPGRG